MVLTLLKGYPDFVGKRAVFVGWGSGPKSYSQATGDILTLPTPNYYIDALASGANSINGAWYVRAQPVGVGPRQTWALFWYSSTGTQASNGADLSQQQIQIGGFCGQY